MPKSKAALIRELHDARAVANTQSIHINSMTVKMAELNAKTQALFPKILSREIEIARLNGYIDRVREVEGKPPEVTTRVMSHPPDRFDMAAMRERLTTVSEEEFERMVSDMDTDTLERVTGRDDADYGRG